MYEDFDYEKGTVVARVANKRIKFLIDSGASVNTISESAFNALLPFKSFKSKLRNFSESRNTPLTAYATSKPLEVIAM